MEKEVHNTGHVGIGYRFRAVASESIFCAERTAASFRHHDYSRSYGRRLRYHLCQGQSGLLVGSTSPLPDKFAGRDRDSIFGVMKSVAVILQRGVSTRELFQ